MKILLDIGTDLTSILNIKKYEPIVPTHLSGMVKGNFPAFLHKTDEPRLQSEPNVLLEAINKGLGAYWHIEDGWHKFYSISP
jgi:hypothetical protein